MGYEGAGRRGGRGQRACVHLDEFNRGHPDLIKIFGGVFCTCEITDNANQWAQCKRPTVVFLLCKFLKVQADVQRRADSAFRTLLMQQGAEQT